MTGFDDLKNSLQHDIELHERLRDILRIESVSIEDNSIMHIPDTISKKTDIEHEIESTSREVNLLMEQYYRIAVHLDRETRNDIGCLVKRLHETIRETIAAVGDTIAAVRRSKQGMVRNISEMNTKQTAITAYLRSRAG